MAGNTIQITPFMHVADVEAATRFFVEVLGLTENGSLTLGQAVFEPTATRVTTVSAQLGGSAQTGQMVMQATSTTRQVQMALDASQQTDVAVGDKVTITLPNNHTTPGVVSSVGAVATCPSSSGSGGSGSSSAAGVRRMAGCPGRSTALATSVAAASATAASAANTVTESAIPSENERPCRPLFQFLAYSGLRIGEALGLTWADIDFDAGPIRVHRQLSRKRQHAPLKTAADPFGCIAAT